MAKAVEACERLHLQADIRAGTYRQRAYIFLKNLPANRSPTNRPKYLRLPKSTSPSGAENFDRAPNHLLNPPRCFSYTSCRPKPK